MCVCGGVCVCVYLYLYWINLPFVLPWVPTRCSLTPARSAGDIYILTYIHTYTYIYTYMYVCVCVYIYI